MCIQSTKSNCFNLVLNSNYYIFSFYSFPSNLKNIFKTFKYSLCNLWTVLLSKGEYVQQSLTSKLPSIEISKLIIIIHLHCITRE